MPKPIPSRQALEAAFARAVKFLRGAGTSPVIRAALATRGYTQQEHDLGWDLVQRCAGQRKASPSIAPDGDPMVLEAIAKLDAWDEPNFEWIEAALDRFHPAVSAYLFDGLSARQGAEAVLAVNTFLVRIDALRSGRTGEDREATRETDHAALRLLAQRGLTDEVLDELAALVRIAMKGTQQSPPPPDAQAAESRAESDQALVDLYFWITDWSAQARVVITRRDYLIRLGLASRKPRGSSSDDGDATDTPEPIEP